MKTIQQFLDTYVVKENYCNVAVKCSLITDTLRVWAHSYAYVLPDAHFILFLAVELYPSLRRYKLVKCTNTQEIIQQFSNSSFPHCQCCTQCVVAASHRLLNDASLYSVKQTVRLYSHKHTTLCTPKKICTYLHWNSHMCVQKHPHTQTSL